MSIKTKDGMMLLWRVMNMFVSWVESPLDQTEMLCIVMLIIKKQSHNSTVASKTTEPALPVKWRRRENDGVPLQCAIGSCGWAGIDVEFILVLESLELVSVARDEDIHVQLPLQESEAGHVAPRDHLVPVDQTDLELSHSHHLLLRVV